MFLDASYGQLFHIILLIPTRWIASGLPGSVVPPLDDEEKLSEQEEQSNDGSIIWPSPDVIAKLPQDWVVQGSESSERGEDASEIPDVAAKVTSKSHSSTKKRRSAKNKIKASSSNSDQKTNLHSNESRKSIIETQPYYLNHVRGSTRIRQASQRIGAAMGTLFASYILCSFSSSLVTFEDIGLGITSAKEVLYDFTCGFLIGSFIVAFIFLLELRMGWIKIVGMFETVDPKEIFAVNFLWDVLFHVGVSINEEVM